MAEKAVRWKKGVHPTHNKAYDMSPHVLRQQPVKTMVWRHQQGQLQGGNNGATAHALKPLWGETVTRVDAAD
jgi:hypothetical protein